MSFSKYFAIDADTGLIKRAPAQAALTSTGYIGTQLDLLAASADDMICIINVESIVINGATGETYKFRIVGSNQTNRSDGEVLAQIETGKASVLGAPETVDGAAGQRLEMRFRTEKVRTRFRYIDLHMVVAGTAPSIAVNAYLSKDLG
jgi:hypothetical protein